MRGLSSATQVSASARSPHCREALRIVRSACPLPGRLDRVVAKPAKKDRAVPRKTPPPVETSAPVPVVRKRGGAQPGAGRPRRVHEPRTEDQARLGETVKRDEADLAAAHETYKSTGTVAAELAWTLAQLAVCSSVAAYCRAQSNLTHAMQYQGLIPKLLRVSSSLRELLATDDLAEIKTRGRREDALDDKSSGRRSAH